MILIQATVAIIYQYVGSREELSPFSETLHLGGGFSSNSSHRTYKDNTEISCVYDVNFLYSFIDILHYLQKFFFCTSFVFHVNTFLKTLWKVLYRYYMIVINVQKCRSLIAYCTNVTIYNCTYWNLFEWCFLLFRGFDCCGVDELFVVFFKKSHLHTQ